MELKNGLYEQVINEIISNNIKNIDSNKKLIKVGLEKHRLLV